MTDTKEALERARWFLDECPDKTCQCHMCQDARALLAEHAHYDWGNERLRRGMSIAEAVSFGLTTDRLRQALFSALKDTPATKEDGDAND